MTWLPLVDHDPVPGDHYGTGDLGCYFLDEAAKLRTMVASLKGLDAGLWEGEAADAFAHRRTHLIPHLETLATRWERGGNALKDWAPAMDDAKTKARKALRDAQEADERRTRAQAQLDAAREQFKVDFLATIAAGPGGADPGVEHDATAIHTLEEEVAAREADIAAVRLLLGQAQEIYETGARRCEAALHAAADDNIENRGGFLAGARRTIHHAVRRFPQIKTFAKYLGLAAGALALAASMFTGVGELALAAFIAGGLATTLDTALMVSGDGKWTTVAWDAFGLVTFGAGRAFASAARGTAATAAVQDTDVLRKVTSLRGIVAEGVSSPRPLTGAAALSRRLALYKEWRVFTPEAARGLGPEPRNWLRAVMVWREIHIPPQDVLGLSEQAVRYARSARVLEGASRANDIRGVVASESEILNEQTE